MLVFTQETATVAVRRLGQCSYRKRLMPSASMPLWFTQATMLMETRSKVRQIETCKKFIINMSLGCSGTVHGGGLLFFVCMCWKNGGHGEEVVWCGSSRKQVDACFKHLFVLGPHWVPQMHKLTPLSWEPSAAWSRQEYSFTCFTCCQGSYCPVAVDWTLNVG